jgi:hypothetical protein
MFFGPQSGVASRKRGEIYALAFESWVIIEFGVACRFKGYTMLVFVWRAA